MHAFKVTGQNTPAKGAAASLYLNRKTWAPACLWTCTRTSGPKPQVSPKHNPKAIQWKPVSPKQPQCAAPPRTPCLCLGFAFDSPSFSSLACLQAAGGQKVISTSPVWESHCPPSPRRQNQMLRQQAPRTRKSHPAARDVPGCCVSVGAWQKWGRAEIPTRLESQMP